MDIHVIDHLVAAEFWLSQDNFFSNQTMKFGTNQCWAIHVTQTRFFIMTLTYVSNVYALSDFVHLVPIDYCYKQYRKLLRHGAFG